MNRKDLPLVSNTATIGIGLGEYKKRIMAEYDEIISVTQALMGLDDAVFIGKKQALWLQEEGEKAIENVKRSSPKADAIPLHPIGVEESLYIAKEWKGNLPLTPRFAYATQYDLSQFVYPMNGAFWVLLATNAPVIQKTPTFSSRFQEEFEGTTEKGCIMCQEFPSECECESDEWKSYVDDEYKIKPHKYKLMMWENKPKGIFQINSAISNDFVPTYERRLKRSYLSPPNTNTTFTTKRIDLDKLTEGKIGHPASNLSADGAWVIEYLKEYNEKEGTWNVKAVGNRIKKGDLSDESRTNLNSLFYADQDKEQKYYRRRGQQEVKKGAGFKNDSCIIKAQHYDSLPKKTFRDMNYQVHDSIGFESSREPNRYRTDHITAFNDLLQFKQSYGNINHTIL